MTTTELKQITDIVNFHISKFNLEITTHDILNLNSTELIHLERKIFDEIFSQNGLSQKDVNRSYFHYKSFDIAYTFLNKEYITLSALSNYSSSTDDLKEYRYFLETIAIGTSEEQIEKNKDEFYVFCFSEDNNTDRFWNEYANSHSGLCIEFEITTTQIPELNGQFELRNICYDDGDVFSFLREMQKDIKDTQIKKGIYATGLSKFAALYKRKEQFSWERETRLFFNNSLYSTTYLNRGLSIENKINKKYLKIEFLNDYFCLKVKSVKIGNNILPANRTRIKELANRKNLNLIE